MLARFSLYSSIPLLNIYLYPNPSDTTSPVKRESWITEACYIECSRYLLNDPDVTVMLAGYDA